MRLRRAGALFLALLLASACSDDKVDTPIYLGASPASLLVGESIVVEVTASEEFFSTDVTQPMASEGGLTLDSLTVEDSTHALVSITSTAETVIGAHRFTLTDGGATATLDVSVLAESAGPGTVTAVGNTATAGASNALLQINGTQTHFDTETTIEVLDAPGFEVAIVDVVSETTIQVTYDIALEQSPTEATIRVIDGVFAYEVPFSITSPAQYESTATDQAVTKGRAGWVTLMHSEAVFDSGTHFEGIDSSIEIGDPFVVSSNEVQFPIRAPFDYSAGSVELVAYTYSQGGASLEIVTTEIALLEPAWVAVSPSELSTGPGLQVVDLAATGTDLTTMDAVSLVGGSSLSLASWEAATATAGTMSIIVTESAAAGAYEIIADDGVREIVGLVAYGLPESGVSVPDSGITAGDHAFTPLVSPGIAFSVDSVGLEGDEDVIAVSWEYVDEHCIVAELDVDETATAGTHVLTLSNGSESLTAFVYVHEPAL